MNDDQNIPALVPITKKKTQNKPSSFNPIQDTQELQISPEEYVSLLNDPKKSSNVQPTHTDPKIEKFKPKEQFQAEKVEQFQKKFRQKSGVSRKDEKSTNTNKRNEENQKSKFLIVEMLNKVSAKNMSEELFPASPQFMDNLIGEIQLQIKQLQHQAEKKQNTLLTNPNNQRLKKQIQDVKKSINQCATIKKLYHDKINSRNKIKICQMKIHELKSENKDLKIKIGKGIEKINGHMHNLPCQREKQLQQQLHKCKYQLSQQKEMRSNLEKNISQIILNFKRLYDEADTARFIVVNKLKDIQERQRKVQILQKMYNQSENDPSVQPQSIKRSSVFDPIPKKSVIPQKEKSIHSNTEEKKHSAHGSHTGETPTGRKINEQYYKGTKKSKYTKQQGQIEQAKLSMEDQIKKMRNNQPNLLKATKK